MKRCAYRNCGKEFQRVAKNARYCSRACKGFESYAIRLNRYADGVIPPRQRGQRQERSCAWEPCGKPLVGLLHQARTCSGTCQRLLAEDRQARHNARRRMVAARPTPVRPSVAAPNALTLPRLGRPCFGCKHMRVFPGSERGVECTAGRFRSCNPLGPNGPLLKEAI